MNAVRQPGRAARRDDLPAAERLRITEIFHSIQGEADSVGWPTVFVRLTGCPLRCGYCDTAYAFHGGEWWSMDEVLAEVGKHGARHVTVTGGEPLAQKNCAALLTRLCDAGYAVSLETSGALPIAGLDPRVARVMDLKTPGSGEVDRNLLENIPVLRGTDQVKFVICDRADYEWARALTAEHKLAERCQVLFSPSHEQVHPKDLAEWILADKLPVRLQVQLHKYLWGNVPGH
ncbi:MAG TPA: 7-carboxy-7-deazaguanine synthase QueE [Gammaproteobacteria bacterium]|nr:7-carboxy-7-deazaguanine synthase QueE [Gammaproteobacteria bacterium]